MTIGPNRVGDPGAASIVMIFLDEEQFIEEAIVSVLAQDWANWELLLVDDGSTDASPAIAREYACRDSRIRLLQHPGHANRGMAASRQLALDQAAGEIMCFLDADDVWPPYALRRLRAALLEYPEVGMAVGATEWWHSWAEGHGDCCDTVVSRAPTRGRPIPPGEFAAAMVRDGAAVPCNCSVAVRIRELRRLGGFDRSFRSLYEDQMLYAKIALEYPVLVVGECFGRYRQHPDQCCVRADAAGETAAGNRRFLEWLADWAALRGVYDGDLREALTVAGVQEPAVGGCRFDDPS